MDLNRVITELRMEWAPNRQYKRDECGVLQTHISNWLLKLELGAVGGLNFCRLVRPGLAYFSAERLYANHYFWKQPCDNNPASMGVECHFSSSIRAHSFPLIRFGCLWLVLAHNIHLHSIWKQI